MQPTMPNPIDVSSSTYDIANNDPVANNDISSNDISRVLPRQLSPGNIRGQMNITGTLTILDPASGNPVTTIDGTNKYTLYTNPNTQINQIIIGELPDGTFGMVVSKTGVDVLTVFT